MQALSAAAVSGKTDKIWLFAACNEASSRRIAEAGSEVS